MRTTKKLGLAAAVVLALFIGFAAPAGAATGDVESGSLNTVLGNFNLAPGSQGTPPCADKPSTLTFTTTAAPNRWTLAGGFSGQFQLPPGSGNWYQADFAILAGSGGGWGGAHPTNTLNGTIGVRVSIYQLQLAGGPLTCAKTNLRCIITGAFTLAATSTYKSGPGNLTGLPNTVGAPVPVPPAPDLADHITIDATSGALVVSSCTAPWNSVAGTSASLVNAQFHVLP